MTALRACEAERVAATISGEQLVDARNRAGLTQAQLATLLDISVRSVQKWEREGVAAGREGRVQAALGSYLTTTNNPPIEELSNWALIMELGRRLGLGHDPASPAAGSPVTPPSANTLRSGGPGGSFSGTRGPRKPQSTE